MKLMVAGTENLRGNLLHLRKRVRTKVINIVEYLRGLSLTLLIAHHFVCFLNAYIYTKKG